MTEKPARRSYRCGSCGQSGHNARKCPAKAAAKVVETQPAVVAPPPTPPVVPVAPVAPVVEEVVEVTPEPVNVVAISTNQDVSLSYEKKDARPARPAAPFECPSCLRVGILALLELQDGQTALRCEYCYTKALPKTILKWGALPKDKPADAPGTIGRWGVNNRPADAL